MYIFKVDVCDITSENKRYFSKWQDSQVLNAEWVSADG